PWRAERYGNAGIYIKEKYDSYQKKFFQEMKVITRNEITTYACYGDLDFITNGTFKKIDETKNPLEVINLSEFK
ncbi:portal protein, partial [Enterococcus sp. C52]